MREVENVGKIETIWRRDNWTEQKKQKPMCFQRGILMKNELIFTKMVQELEATGMGESRDEA